MGISAGVGGWVAYQRFFSCGVSPTGGASSSHFFPVQTPYLRMGVRACVHLLLSDGILRHPAAAISVPSPSKLIASLSHEVKDG